MNKKKIRTHQRILIEVIYFIFNKENFCVNMAKNTQRKIQCQKFLKNKNLYFALFKFNISHIYHIFKMIHIFEDKLFVSEKKCQQKEKQYSAIKGNSYLIISLNMIRNFISLNLHLNFRNFLFSYQLFYHYFLITLTYC